MRTTSVFPLLACLLFSSATLAASTSAVEKTPSAAQLAQQQKMTDCNQQAATQSLKGDDRKKFMSQCLSAQINPANKMTPQQMKMKTCNADAAKQELKGDERKTFMSQCLKKSS
ncbi:PsiF family protein [Edaphovirga cremea]|uniref:PsiF family protein n=1 Tax=Edaphovirga cremea TaxID=2267246 RepID=UPI000DF0084C|nr:PsiF family protein [Edaphovirga cremea]